MRYTVLSAAVLPVLGCLAGAAAAQNNLAQCESYPRGEESYACLCPPPAQSTGAVWGSGPYTLDSSICQAAAHAGVITANGGPVLAVALEGLDSYDGSLANGVQTSTWGSYDASFMFETANAAPVKYGTGGDCAGFPQSLDTVTCSCTAQATAKGTFWGNDPYTIDSDICIAARHSGIIGPEGGVVTAIRVMGLDNYTSSSNNGVESTPSGPFDGSMVFDRN